ncbi:hypothetical protein RHSIM_Rhsim04G0027800 [Rhododendron simsii]|uniref:protein-serine/threonine phosphatase n=1 Tax=Rhododendron simsii TaxID=118357 RepID=A0A834H203_RHOSS|nr:hypothetical protein RHSIM_Rhsim04G0027800 [Rhododendron simsii]
MLHCSKSYTIDGVKRSCGSHGSNFSRRSIALLYRFDMFRSVFVYLRANEIVVEHGYEFFAKRQLVTVFSAPNYCGELNHAGALISVDENLMCSFQILKPAEKKSKFMMSTNM